MNDRFMLITIFEKGGPENWLDSQGHIPKDYLMARYPRANQITRHRSKFKLQAVIVIVHLP